MTLETPTYHLPYMQEGQPAYQLRAVWQLLAERAEAALIAGGITPPGASDLAALVGRVNLLEARRAKQVYTLGGSNPGWASTAMLWVAGLGAKITIPADGVPRTWTSTVAVNVIGTGRVRYRCDLAAIPGKAATSTYWPATDGQRFVTGTNEIGGTVQAGGSLLGDQAATLYVEARAEVANGATFNLPSVINTQLATA